MPHQAQDNKKKQVYQDKTGFHLQEKEDFDKKMENYPFYSSYLERDFMKRKLTNELYLESEIELAFGRDELKKFERDFQNHHYDKIRKYEIISNEKASTAAADLSREHGYYGASKRRGKFETSAQKYKEANQIYTHAQEELAGKNLSQRSYNAYLSIGKFKALDRRLEAMRWAAEGKAYDRENKLLRQNMAEIKIATAKLALIKKIETEKSSYWDKVDIARRLNRPIEQDQEYEVALQQASDYLTAKKATVEKQLAAAKKYYKSHSTVKVRELTRNEIRRRDNAAAVQQRYCDLTNLTDEQIQEKYNEFDAARKNALNTLTERGAGPDYKRIREEYQKLLNFTVDDIAFMEKYHALLKRQTLVIETPYKYQGKTLYSKKIIDSSDPRMQGFRLMHLFPLTYENEPWEEDPNAVTYRHITSQGNSHKKKDKKEGFEAYLNELMKQSFPMPAEVKDFASFGKFANRYFADITRITKFGLTFFNYGEKQKKVDGKTVQSSNTPYGRVLHRKNTPYYKMLKISSCLNKMLAAYKLRLGVQDSQNYTYRIQTEPFDAGTMRETRTTAEEEYKQYFQLYKQLYGEFIFERDEFLRQNPRHAE